MSRALDTEWLCEKLWNFNTLSLLQQSDSSPINLFEKGIGPTFLQKVIITPSCGTASLSTPLTEKGCQLTAEVSKRMRKKE